MRCSWLLELSGVTTSGAEAGRSFLRSLAHLSPSGRVRSSILRWCSACTARGWGATGGGSGVLQVGGALVQYAQPSASRPRPSWSRPTRGRMRGRTGNWASNHDLPVPRRHQKGLGRKGEAGPEMRTSGPAPNPTESVPTQSSVHSADINDPAIETPSENRWNAAVCLRRAAPMQG